MKLAYFDCASGISGDMTLAALVDAGAPLEAVQSAIDSLGLPSCRLVAQEVRRCGFRALKIDVEHEPEHKHRHLHHIVAMIRGSRLSPRQQTLAEQIFTRLGEAEARVHGTTIQKVHFHEVGAVDSIADIVGVAVAFDLLGIERLVASPVPTGQGFVEIAHGRCSIPTPATAELLRGIPIARSEVEAELTTPTGAAVLAALATDFGPPPAMRVGVIGCGAGTRELPGQPNLLRILLGESSDAAAQDEAWVIETNLDDLSGERIAHCTSELLRAGALDVYTTAIQMKKNRPGVLLSVLCHGADRERLAAIMFRETTTLGVRYWPTARRILPRRQHQVTTPWGPVQGVVAWRGSATPTFAPEFEACRLLAEQHGLPLGSMYEAAHKAFDPAQALPANPPESRADLAGSS
ncbi:MAG: nickel pincer cofactor biosynthesis protein LarC [Planctomycetia bacterium]|nr:nickel pincer cofactor biosynthesis protein LarC [Planctomycetia bacterium]